MVRYTADRLHAILQVIISMILEVINTLLELIARVLSEIFFGAAFIIGKILAVMFPLLLLLASTVGSFILQIAQEFAINILPRVLSEICFGAGKILTFILHLLLFTRGLVDLAGYGILSTVFIVIFTVFLIWWFLS